MARSSLQLGHSEPRLMGVVGCCQRLWYGWPWNGRAGPVARGFHFKIWWDYFCQWVAGVTDLEQQKYIQRCQNVEQHWSSGATRFPSIRPSVPVQRAIIGNGQCNPAGCKWQDCKGVRSCCHQVMERELMASGFRLWHEALASRNGAAESSQGSEKLMLVMLARLLCLWL